MATQLRVRDVMTRDVETIREGQQSDILPLLRRFRRFEHLPVLDGQDRLVGLLTRMDVLEQAALPGSKGPVLVQELMSSPPTTIQESQSVEAAARLMASSQLHSLVVVDASGALAGIITDGDILRAISGMRAAAPRLDELPAEMVMTPDPVSIDAEATVGDAAGAMLEAGVRHLPVVDSDRRLVGIVSERDLRTRLATDLRSWTQAPPSTLDEPIAGSMAGEPIAVRPSTSLADCLEAFTDERVGALPIVDEDDRLVGILSYVDLLRWLREHVRAAEPAPAQP